MRQTLTNAVLPDLAGTVGDMAQAVYDLSEAFTDPPPPTTTTSTTTNSPSSTTSTSMEGDDCYCCCAFWDRVDEDYYCLESDAPQTPSNGEPSNCFYYPASSMQCGTGFCES